MDDATAALRRTEKGDILGGGQVTTLPPVVPKVLAKKLPISCLAQCGDQEHPPPPPLQSNPFWILPLQRSDLLWFFKNCPWTVIPSSSPSFTKSFIGSSHVEEVFLDAGLQCGPSHHAALGACASLAI